jgi:hypothetical protein
MDSNMIILLILLGQDNTHSGRKKRITFLLFGLGKTAFPTRGIMPPLGFS